MCLPAKGLDHRLRHDWAGVSEGLFVPSRAAIVGRTLTVMRYEISLEVLDAAFPASGWQRAYGDRLTATALEHGGKEWRWIERSWGVVLEIAFGSEDSFYRWRDVPAVRSAFDAVPDPIHGLIFHRGWGGTSGSGEPRRPRPRAGAGAAELPVPEPDEVLEDHVAESGPRPHEGLLRTAAYV